MKHKHIPTVEYKSEKYIIEQNLLLHSNLMQLYFTSMLAICCNVKALVDNYIFDFVCNN